MKIRDLISATSATVLNTNIDLDADVRISTDTRTIQKGDFYLPLKGASFDGEKFINQAIEKGAIGAFCTGNNGTLKVNDTLVAYLQLANWRRNKLNFTVVAITGSSGKTTTKELVASTLSEKYKTFKTPLNHNNEIGFCQTIFEAPDDTEVLVLEMGMRGLGEIELLSKYAEPDITIITGIGTSHIGRLGSKENIAKAKCEIVKYQRGNVFIALNDELIKNTVNFNGKKIFYSLKDTRILERQAHYTKFEYEDNIYELNVGGDYNVENALAAIQAGKTLNMTCSEIKNGLKKYKPIEKRWECVNAGGYEIINDSYNANPESMRAFIKTITELYDNYTIVLGEMGELGEETTRYHSKLGEFISNNSKLDKNTQIISVGNISKHITDNIKSCKTAHCDNIEDAAQYIKNNIQKNTKIFLKASRYMKFEKIIEILMH